MPEAESDTFPQYEQNYALYNAPPGTWQKMSMFFYASPEAGEATRQAALAFTHNDVFKAVPGYKTFVNHFHLRVVDRMRAERVRHAAAGSDGDEGDRPQHHRPERFPRRQPGGR